MSKTNDQISQAFKKLRDVNDVLEDQEVTPDNADYFSKAMEDKKVSFNY